MLKASWPRFATAANWSSTLNLPRSAFPPRASPTQRPAYLVQCTDDLYAWQSAARRTQRPFVLHDGPPYANGPLHIGHALNKILKDVICRFHISQGRLVQYRPGWDCHGLPIEIKALQTAALDNQDYRSLSSVDIRKRARALAIQTVADQKNGFKAWGVLGEWQNPYKTMSTGFVTAQLRVFQRMVERGLIYRSFTPVYWSPSSVTALAEAELEYDDNHVSKSAFIKYQLEAGFNQRLGLGHEPVYALIWTTTPWTLPANRAIAVNRDLSYSIIRLPRSGCNVVIASKRLSEVLKIANIDKNEVGCLIETVSGEDLLGEDGLSYFNPFCPHRHHPVLHADYVSDSSGTGLVHTAPGHGFEDYDLCRKHGIIPFAPVDEQGCFTADAFPAHPEMLQGKNISADGQQAVLDWLAGHAIPSVNLVWATHDYTHKYPIDWRTKLPVIIRATAQWFAKVDSIKDQAVKALQGVHFLPQSGKPRLEGFVMGRNQWCISRQRAWGVPIPVLYDSTGQALIESSSIEHIIKTIAERGTDAWWSDSPDDPAWTAPEFQGKTYTRGRDTMDVWFDSGTTWTQIIAAGGDGPPADVYIEGTDQHRGWFQSSLLTYVAQQSHGRSDDANLPVHPPFKSLITHGFILDADGRKMSKSIGNVISPDQIMSGELLPPVKGSKKKSQHMSSNNFDAMGPDALRLWVATSDYTKDVLVSETILKGVHSTLHKLRVTFKWLLGALADYNPTSNSDTEAKQHISDRLALAQSSLTVCGVHAAYAAYDFNKAISTLTTHINTHLSSFYFETAKDPLYAGDGADRLRAQSTCFQILRNILHMLGPTLPLLVTEVLDHASPSLRHLLKPNDLNLNDQDDLPLHTLLSRPWGPTSASSVKEAEETLAKHDILFRIHDTIKTLQEHARVDRKIGSGLESRLLLSASDEVLASLDRPGMCDELAEMFVVSGVEIERLDVREIEKAVERSKASSSTAQGKDWCYRESIHVGLDGGEKVPLLVEIRPPQGDKCPRCWRWVVERAKPTAEVCIRCENVLREKGVEADGPKD